MTATYTAPRTWVSGELVTAALMNTHVRDIHDWFKTPSAAIDNSSAIATSSASLVDVTGASVTFTNNGGGFDVFIVVTFSNSTLAGQVSLSLNVDSATERTLQFTTLVANNSINASFPYHVSALAAGSHTFKLQTATSAGTVTITGFQLYVREAGA